MPKSQGELIGLLEATTAEASALRKDVKRRQNARAVIAEADPAPLLDLDPQGPQSQPALRRPRSPGEP